MAKRRTVPMLGLKTPIEQLTANAANRKDDHRYKSMPKGEF
jgi:hypothetical protein